MQTSFCTVVDSRAAFDSGSWDPEVAVATGETVIDESRTGYDPIDSATSTSATSGWILGAATVSTQEMGVGATDLISKSRYDDLGRAVESRGPGSNGADANTELSFFYTAGSNPETGCGSKPEWAGLPCVTRTAESTQTKPVSRATGYSMLLLPTTSTETLNGVTRTSTTEYLADGREHASEIAVTGLSGTTAVERSETIYDTATALPLASITKDGFGAETGRVSNTNDLWGRTLTYTDADSAVTTSTYDSAGRLATVVDPKRTVTYSYDGTDAAGNEEHRGLGTGMTIGGVGAFTAAYDAGGNLTK